MDHWEEKQDAREVNVTLDDVSSPKAKEKEHGYHGLSSTPRHRTTKESVDLEPQSPLELTLLEKQLTITHIDSGNDNGSPRTPRGVVFNPFAPGHEDLARAPQSRKYTDEVRNNSARKLHFHSSTHTAESKSIS